MNNTSPKSNVTSVEEIYAQLNPSDIEQFYAGYQRWHLQQQITALQTQVDAVRQQIVENTQRMQEVHPSASALAALARLQANGVSDIDLLDRMLERGENWLDQTMQRLDYFLQMDDFIRDDYTQWCRHALEGAYDWIDSIQNQDASIASSPQVSTEETRTEATEEQLLQKLSSDGDEDEASMLEVTLKRPAVAPPPPEEPAPAVESLPSTVEAVSPVEAPPASPAPAEQVTTQPGEEYIPLVGERAPAGDSSLSTSEQPNIQEYIAPEEPHFAADTSTSDSEPTAIQEYATVEEPASDAEQPAIHEYILPRSEEHMPASDNAKAVLQEYAKSKEPLPFEESTASNAEQPVIQEYATSAAIESRATSDSEETTTQEHITPEGPPSVESTAISGSERPAVQEPVEITPVNIAGEMRYGGYSAPPQGAINRAPTDP